MKYFKKLEANKIYLSPMNPDDTELYTKWINDILVSAPLGHASNVVSLPGEREFVENACKEGQNFAVCLKETDELIGNASLMSINTIHRTAEVGLFIGDEEHRGNGYGVEILELLLAYGFLVLNLNNIMLRVFSFNKRGIKAYKKVGFTEMGRRHQAHYINGSYHDEIYMEVLKDQYKCKYLANVLPQ